MLPCARRWRRCGTRFDLETLEVRSAELTRELQSPSLWTDPPRAIALTREHAGLLEALEGFRALDRRVQALHELQALAAASGDPSLDADLGEEAATLRQDVQRRREARWFDGPHDGASAVLQLQAGAGGREAEAWAALLLRQYLRWAERAGFAVCDLDTLPGEAGLKRVRVTLEGPRAYGWLRRESGVHRLIRVSPFGAGNRLQTSFAAVDVTPVLPPVARTAPAWADIGVDTYRASGPGGQYVNKTESAVRLHHRPSGLVVACQSERSQHRNLATAYERLTQLLTETALADRRAVEAAREAQKSDVAFGHQLRTYALAQSRVTDHRSGYSSGRAEAVLDGDLAPLLEAALAADRGTAGEAR